MQNSCIIYILRILYIYIYIQYTYEHISGNFSKLKTQTLKEIDYIVNSVKIVYQIEEFQRSGDKFPGFLGRIFWRHRRQCPTTNSSPVENAVFFIQKKHGGCFESGPIFGTFVKKLSLNYN